MPLMCKAIGCATKPIEGDDFCEAHRQTSKNCRSKPVVKVPPDSMALLYPKYYKPVGDLTEVDVYAIHKLFNIQDPSGAIQHASKKLLLAGVRTGSKSMFKDIKEAQDTLTRWLQLNPEV